MARKPESTFPRKDRTHRRLNLIITNEEFRRMTELSYEMGIPIAYIIRYALEKYTGEKIFRERQVRGQPDRPGEKIVRADRPKRNINTNITESEYAHVLKLSAERGMAVTEFTRTAIEYYFDEPIFKRRRRTWNTKEAIHG